jgi:hypothetical protein
MADEKKLLMKREFKCDFIHFIAIKFAGITARKSEVQV